jgi:nucleoside-diphosphate-sugar epimerase
MASTNSETLHVVLGATGGVGRAVAGELIRQGATRVRGVAHTGKGDVPTGVELVLGDAANVEDMQAICREAGVIYFCVNPPYTDWPRAFPPMLEGAIDGARTSGARLVVTDNLYVYAPTSKPLTEDLPWRPVTRKGRVRAAMDERLLAAHRAGQIRMTIGRASDFFGPGALNTGVIGENFFQAYFAGKRVDWLGKLDVPHSFSYVEDFARGLVTLGQHEEALGQAWHISGRTAEIRAAGKTLLRVGGIFSPLMRELAEMAYEFEQPFIMDGSKFTRAFGGAPTPLPMAIQETVSWFRARFPTP